MKLSTIAWILWCCSIATSYACTTKGEWPDKQAQETADNNTEKDTINNTTMNETETLIMTVGTDTFMITLQDNATARAFRTLLPMTASMTEHAGNEKYFYLPADLPTNASRPDKIHAGDIMLWGDNCLVVFYDTFTTTYSYTRIGRVDAPAGLKTALGAGDVKITFSIK